MEKLCNSRLREQESLESFGENNRQSIQVMTMRNQHENSTAGLKEAQHLTYQSNEPRMNVLSGEG